MTKTPLKILTFLTALIILSACSNNTPEGPDLSAVSDVDVTFFTASYNQCNINNTKYDCNCVARVELDQRNTAYEVYKSDYQSIHKSALEHKIETMEATINEKSKNASDERIIESLEDDLARLKRDLERGINNKDNFTPPAILPRSTDQCIITD